MENQIMNTETECVSEIAKHSHVNIDLDGWPAAASVIALALSGVAIYGIKIYSENQKRSDKHKEAA